MGELFAPAHLLILFILFCIIGPVVIVPYWQIFKKAGFPPVLSLLVVVPLVNLVVMYYVAFSNWKLGARRISPVNVAGPLV